MKNIENKTVWITGASSGIGKSLAIEIAEQGGKVVLISRNKKKLDEVKNILKGNGHVVFPLDLMDIKSIPIKIKELLKIVNNKIDILINNAGVSQRSLIINTEFEIYKKLMDINYFSIVMLTKTILPYMISNNSGYVVTISSVAGKLGTPMRGAYCGAKHAIIGFMDSLRAEFKSNNINVLVITPGSIKTNISINALEGDGSKHNIVDPMISNGISAKTCSKHIINGIKKNKKELVIANKKEKIAVFLRRFFPNILFSLMAKIKST